MFAMLFIFIVFLVIRLNWGLSTFVMGLAMTFGAFIGTIFCPVAGIIGTIAWAILASGKPGGKH
jgi:hypothetical protein